MEETKATRKTRAEHMIDDLSAKCKEENAEILKDLRNIRNEMHKLGTALSKMAHYGGNDKIIIEHGLEPWVPGKDDMRKYKD